MVSYPQPYPIVTHQSPAHGAGGGPGSQYRDSIGMGHVTRQVKFISAAVTHSTSTDSLYTTRLSDNLGPIRSGPDSRSRTVTRYCNKENIRRMTLQLCYFRSRGYIYYAFLSGRQLLIFASSTIRFRRLLVDLQNFQTLLRQILPSSFHQVSLLSTSANYANPAS